MSPSMWANRRNPRTACIEVLTDAATQACVAQAPDIQLHVGPSDPVQRIEPVGLAPAEPPPQLGGIQRVGAAGVAGEKRDRCQTGRAQGIWLDGSSVVLDGLSPPSAGCPMPVYGSAAP
jgi:hypothetical protein